MLGKYDDGDNGCSKHIETWEWQVVTPVGQTTHKDTSFNHFDIRVCVLKIQYKKSEVREKNKSQNMFGCCFFYLVCVCRGVWNE